MEIKDFGFSIEYGFAWITVEGKYSDSEDLTIQCCLDADKDNKIVKQVTMSECGADWGVCYDANKKAFDYYGENRCLKALFAKARENGITILP